MTRTSEQRRPVAPVPATAAAQDSEIMLRAARSADVDAILETVQSAYRGEGGWTTESHLVRGARSTEQQVHELLADPDVTLLVAERPSPVADTAGPVAGATGPAADTAGGVVGCCYTRVDGRRAELGLFAVHPSAQSGGIGGRLLEAQAEQLTAAGVQELMIQVLQSRPELHDWYQRHGFRPTGTELPFPADPTLLTVQGLRMTEMVRQLQAS